MDSSFMKCIEEIEKSYIHLNKVQRIRVEKWVEKLVTIGSNTVWRKHRNAYARLLLSMIVSKKLTEPFNILPPEGPLPSYPFHLKPVSKDMIGTHETSFWRDLYSRLHQQDNGQQNESFSFVKELHSVDVSSSSIKFKENKSANPVSREIQNLQLLIKEQEQKILFLEQQLHEEKVKHELHVQRINYAHRMEIENLLSEKAANHAPQPPTRSKSPFENSFASRRDESSNNVKTSGRLWDQIPSNQSSSDIRSTSFSSTLRLNDQQQPSFPKFQNFSFTNRNDINPANPISVVEIVDDGFYRGVNADIIPSNHKNNSSDANRRHSSSVSSRDSLSDAYQRQQERKYETIIPQPHNKSELDNLSRISLNEKSKGKELNSSSDEEFLDYIDKFQTEIKKMNLDDGPQPGQEENQDHQEENHEEQQEEE